MNVNIEFLGKEPIENLITCMNYKMDKTIYFGYSEVIEELAECTTNFLVKYCGLKKENILFKELSHTDYAEVLQGMRVVLQEEKAAGNRMFFDITGGEGLMLVAFGRLSQEFQAPMHLFDVKENRLIEVNEGEAHRLMEAKGDKTNPSVEKKGDTERSVNREVLKRSTTFGLDAFIEMRGGIINSGKQKAGKREIDRQVLNKLPLLWKLVVDYKVYWNAFSTLLRSQFKPDARLCTSVSEQKLEEAMKKSKNALKNIRTLYDILNRLEKIGAIVNGKTENGKCSFRYRSESFKECLWDGGSILEMYTHELVKGTYDDSCIGVHIDWDGIIQPGGKNDVLNEIDVLTLKGNVLTFISCKSGSMAKNNAMTALYELETVARRFGGKHVKKVLAILQPMGDVSKERAKEMGIEVWSMSLQDFCNSQ